MDAALEQLMAQPAEGEFSEIAIDVIDPRAGRIQVECPGGPRDHTLRPLAELFAPDSAEVSISWTEDRCLPLLSAIESQLSREYRLNRFLTDAQVALSLKKLSMNPAADCGDDEICSKVQLGLRLGLSLSRGGYSRQEVKLAIRKVLKSVERHTRLAGPQGYLNFIVDFV